MAASLRRLFAQAGVRCYNAPMTQNVRSAVAAGRRCPNCGTRVAQNAETCFFCGQDLTEEPGRRRRITWLDVVLVGALLAVVVVWWQFGGRGEGDQPVAASTQPGALQPLADATGSPGDDTPQAPAGLPTVEEGVAAGQAEPASFVVRHRVQAGETLLAIAAQYGVTVEEIQVANGLTDALIRAGDELLIPVAEAISEAAPESVDASVETIFNYTVRSGDTLISIAVRFGTQVDVIQEVNGIGPNDFIQPNQTIQVPVAGVPSTVLASSEAARDLPGGGQAGLYESPRLIGPGDDELVPRAEDVLFRWLSVDLLQPNEWYVLNIWPRDGLFELPPPVWTKATSYRLSNRWAPPPNRAVTYGWQVSVVRVLPDTGTGRSIEAASDPSEVRNFAWQ